LTIRRIVNNKGEVMRYRVRVERKKTGPINRSFKTEEAAILFVTTFNRCNPSKLSDARNKAGVVIKDVIEHPERYRDRPPEIMQINGCLLTRGPGRCEPMTECPHYLERGTGCLDMAERAAWQGWSAERA